MQTRILDGRKTAEAIKAEVQQEVEQLSRQGVTPGLAVVLVGEDPASQIYVSSKARTCRELGMRSERIDLPVETTTDQLLQVIQRLNRDERVDGILIQLPLPEQVDEEQVLSAVDPAKDVDGFHPENMGRLLAGRPRLVPCTPMGILEMLRRESVSLAGTEAVVVGRSNIVGKPLALLLLQENATVTICHSKTRDLPQVCRRADLLVAAVGRPGLITREYIKEGAVIVDVGTNRVEDRGEVARLFGHDSPRLHSFDQKGSTLVGDVHPCQAMGIASAVTPVPGGVGPLTIAHLMKNTVTACQARRGGRP